MIVNIYAVYDSVNGSYGPLSLAQNNEVAIRNAKMSVMNDKQTQQIANDLSLYMLGTYDVENGVIKPCDSQMIIRFSDLIPKEAK